MTYHATLPSGRTGSSSTPPADDGTRPGTSSAGRHAAAYPQGHTWWHVVARDAGTVGISPGWARALFWFPIVGGMLVAATIVHKPLFRWLLAEDNPIEWAEYGCLAFAALAAALGAVRAARARRWLAAAILVPFALGTFGLAGEEISWGQRVFGVASPTDVASVNAQGELNLHNLNTGGLNLDMLSDYVSIVMSIALLALCLVTRLPSGGASWRGGLLARDHWRVVSPTLALAPGLALSALYPLGQLVPAVSRLGAFWSYEEWSELCRYLSLAVLAGASAATFRRPTPRPGGDPADGADVTGLADLADLAAPAGPFLAEAPLAGMALACVVMMVVFAILTIHFGMTTINS